MEIRGFVDFLKVTEINFDFHFFPHWIVRILSVTIEISDVLMTESFIINISTSCKNELNIMNKLY